MNPMSRDWTIAVDVGGTFTDCVGIAPDGSRHVAKIPSSGFARGNIARWASDTSFVDETRREVDDFWNGALLVLDPPSGRSSAPIPVIDYNGATSSFTLAFPPPVAMAGIRCNYRLDCQLPAPILGAHQMMGIPIADPLPRCSLQLGTTRGTNALLTRSGARTALLTTKGFADILKIGDQTRPELFALTVRKQPPLTDHVLEIRERVLADGVVDAGLDKVMALRGLRELREIGVESLAICLMHGYRFPKHERILADLAREAGFMEVCVSSEVAPLVRFLDRAETVVLDAYLNPVLRSWLDDISRRLGSGSQLRTMTSSGALVDRKRFSGKDSLLSGPAGGVVGSAWAARQAGYEKAIGLDMGGTSTDVSRFDGEFDTEFESRKAGVRVLLPVLAIETVAAGGGSVCRFDGSRLTVGPESAGADPGPACYGLGGPFTVTDANLLLGRIRAEDFPFPLNKAAARDRALELGEKVAASGFAWSIEQIAEGCLQIANHHMAGAIRAISVARGYDPAEYPLVAFGGAAAQHGCELASILGMKTVVVHPLASVLSAAGIHIADQASHQVRSVLRRLNEVPDGELMELFGEMEQFARLELANEIPGYRPAVVRTRFDLELRYEGTATSERVEYRENADMKSRFETIHEMRYGYLQHRPIEIVAARLVATVPGESFEKGHASGRAEVSSSRPRPPDRAETEQKTATESECLSQQTPRAMALASLRSGEVVSGPAIITDIMTTTVVSKGWRCRVQADRCLILEQENWQAETDVDRRTVHVRQESDPVLLEIFNQLFVSIATRMGNMLRNTASSVNVKERLDFSCAVFTRTGNLVVNAPHIPVHLGAMSESVRSTIARNPEISRGDVFVTNNPYAGGSHLPDVTVLTPVFAPEGNELVFWVASRAHHAEIGGTAPGSMPAGARTLGEEGVLIDNFRLVHDRVARFDDLLELFSRSEYPSRNPAENVRDIQAQVAANRCGEAALHELIHKYSWPVVSGYMERIQQTAEIQVRRFLEQVGPGRRPFEDCMDSGQVIRLAMSTGGGEMTLDFAGTDGVLVNNLNANPAIVSSAVLYVLRTLINADIPLNEGMLRPIRIILPECFLNPRAATPVSSSPPVVGGNVETSQRLVDVLLGALGKAAASQGTMNNWLIGNASWGYYETVGGGSGATAAGDGESAVHCHMSNTRLTDPEILENRYPLILRECSIRKGSGGAGLNCGGDGMVRHMEFRAPLTLSLLTGRRNSRPYGTQGGKPGQSGENRLIRADGSQTLLDWQCEVQMNPGDALRLETPGGGGWGNDQSRP
jgi:5-oxoprolinase (ATP-hydrolysing)